MARLVHLLVRTVAAVYPHDGRLIAVLPAEHGGSAERLGPIGGESLGVVRMEPVAECVTHDVISDHALMPSLSQAKSSS